MTKQKVQGGHPNIGETMGEGEKQKRKPLSLQQSCVPQARSFLFF